MSGLLDRADQPASVQPRPRARPTGRPGPTTAAPRPRPASARHRAAASDKVQQCLLRFGIGFAFFYAAVSAILDPATFAGYFPRFVPVTVVTGTLLPVFALYEAGLAACLLAGRHTFVVSLLATLTLVSIVLFNPGAFDVLFRNVAIASASAALAVQARPLRRRCRP